MTIGIGGWGSRRKPMALVRAILRSPLRDLTIVSYAGPTWGCSRIGQGAEDRQRLRVARLDRARAALPGRPAERRPWSCELDEGMLQWGLSPPRSGCPSCRSGPASART